MNEQQNVNTSPKAKKKCSFWWLKLLFIIIILAAGVIGGIMLSSQEITQQIMAEIFPAYAMSSTENTAPVETVAPTEKPIEFKPVASPAPSKAPVEIISPEAEEKAETAETPEPAESTEPVETVAPTEEPMPTAPVFAPAAEATAVSIEPIGIDAALEIALEHAGANLEESFIYSVSREKDDGLVYYEVDFAYNGREYEYEINAYTGVIEGWETVRQKNSPAPAVEEEPAVTAADYISLEAAKKTALEHAGYIEAATTDMNARLEIDHNRLVYEIEFWAEGYDYDYKVDASSGLIISREKDRD